MGWSSTIKLQVVCSRWELHSNKLERQKWGRFIFRGWMTYPWTSQWFDRKKRRKWFFLPHLFPRSSCYHITACSVDVRNPLQINWVIIISPTGCWDAGYHGSWWREGAIGCGSQLEKLMQFPSTPWHSILLKQKIYPLVNVYITNWKDPPFLTGKCTMNDHFQ